MPAGRDFVHVIMTRFNLATPGRESRIRLRPGWLAERFDLFERYCLPSVAAQTEQGFRWVIYFDVETPQEFRDRIEACRRVHPFVPYFTPLFPGSGWPRSLRELLGDPPARSRGAGPAPWLLTTRLDNDDALAVDHVARLQAAVAALPAPQRCSLNFTHGFVLNDGRVYAHEHRSNAFASWLEPWDAPMCTAQDIEHMKMADHGPIRQIDGPPPGCRWCTAATSRTRSAAAGCRPPPRAAAFRRRCSAPRRRFRHRPRKPAADPDPQRPRRRRRLAARAEAGLALTGSSRAGRGRRLAMPRSFTLSRDAAREAAAVHPPHSEDRHRP